MKKRLLVLLLVLPLGIVAMEKCQETSVALYTESPVKKMKHNTDANSTDYEIIYEDGTVEQFTFFPSCYAERCITYKNRKYKSITMYGNHLLQACNDLWNSLPSRKKSEAEAHYA